MKCVSNQIPGQDIRTSEYSGVGAQVSLFALEEVQIAHDIEVHLVAEILNLRAQCYAEWP